MWVRGDDRKAPAPAQARPAETYAAIVGVLGALAIGIYEAISGRVANEAIVSAVLFLTGAVPLAKTHQFRRAKALSAPSTPSSAPSAEPAKGQGGAAVALNNPTETGSSVAGAVAAILVAVFHVTNQAVISALPALIGAVPMAITWLVDPRIRATHLQTENDLLRQEILPLREHAARLETRNDLLRE